MKKSQRALIAPLLFVVASPSFAPLAAAQSALPPAGSSGSSNQEAGPCASFFGNIPPGSLGQIPATGSIGDTVNSVAGIGSGRAYPRWTTGATGTIPVLRGATSVRQLVTGPSSPSKTDELYNIHGTDLGIVFSHRDRTMLLFGDTFGNCQGADKDWRSNVMLAAAGGNPDSGLKVLNAVPADSTGRAAALVQGAHQPDGVGEVTVIPTAAISTGTAMYMRIMSVRAWGTPGGWDTNYSALAKSNDDGQSWQILPDTMRRITNFREMAPSVTVAPSTNGLPEGELPAVNAGKWSGSQMSAFVQVGNMLYEYTTPSGRFGGAQLARVPLGSIEDPTAYQWFNGSGWGSEPTGHLVLPAPVTELSVQYNKYLGKYVAMYPSDGGSVAVRVSNRPEGPWSRPQVLVDQAMFPNGYAPMLHPFTSTSSSRYLYYTLSTWDAYNVFFLRTDLDAFNFSAPDGNARTTVSAQVPVSQAALSGAVGPDGQVDENQLRELSQGEQG